MNKRTPLAKKLRKNAMDKDKRRDQWFRNQGYRVLRFWDNQVLQSLEIVLEEIYKACITPPPPNPLPQKGSGNKK